MVKKEQEEFVEAAKKRVEGLKSEWAEKEAVLLDEVGALKSELEALRDFKERKMEIEDQMERLRVECEELRAGQAARAAELERKFIEQNTKLKKEYEQKLEDLKKSAEEDIDERLDASVKRILQQNRRMAEELRLHVQETDELQREKKVLEVRRRGGASSS